MFRWGAKKSIVTGDYVLAVSFFMFRWGAKKSIVTGDYVLAVSVQLLADTKNPKVL